MAFLCFFFSQYDVAIQLLWDTGDYLSTNSQKLLKFTPSADGVNEHFELTAEKELSLEDIWMLLFSRLADICIDLRFRE